MKAESARALTWFAAVMIVVGCLVGSPSGAFCAFFVALVLAVFPAILGRGRTRLAAAVLLLAALGLAASKYPDFKASRKE